MATTIPDITVPTDSWVDLNTISGIAVGTQFQISNKGTSAIRLYESTTVPPTDSLDGEILTVEGYRAIGVAQTGSETIWARSIERSSKVTVQEVV